MFKLKQIRNLFAHKQQCQRWFHKKLVHVREDIKYAVEKCQPVVALESTIITHGMPYPDNIRYIT